jgi:hypothetical protein
MLAIVITPDSTFIPSCEDAERHLEVRGGEVPAFQRSTPTNGDRRLAPKLAAVPKFSENFCAKQKCNLALEWRAKFA